MDIQQRIDELMKQNNIDTYITLLRKIFKCSVRDESKTDVQWATNQKSNFTNMLKGKRHFTEEMILGLEHVLRTSMDSIINDLPYKERYQPRGLEYTVACDDFSEYLKLDGETDDEAVNILRNTDEYNKSLLDYIIKYRSANGIRFLCEKHNFFFNPMNNMFYVDSSMPIICGNYDSAPMEIAKLLAEKEETDLFIEIFDPFYETSRYVDTDRYLYNKKEFVRTVLTSGKVLQKMLSSKEIPIKDANRGLVSYGYDFDDVSFINPLLMLLLQEAVNQGNYTYIKQIVDFGRDFNKKQLQFIHERLSEKQLKNIRVDDIGYLSDGRTKIGNLLVYCEPIDPTLPDRIKILLNDLTAQKEELELLPEIDYDGGVHKSFKIVDNKYVLKKSSNNPVEYEMLRYMGSKGFSKVPEFYETKDGVDRFGYIQGETFKYKQGRTNEKLNSLIRFLKEFHSICEQKLGKGNAYLHGKYDNEDIVYDGENVKAVINWDNCYIGNPYEDLVEIIFEWTDISSYIRRNDRVLRSIREILKIYRGDEACESGFAQIMKDCMEKKLERIDKSANNYSGWYETIKHAETFVDLYESELNNL